MNWRPWIIAASMFAMLTVNSALLWFEEVEPPEGSEAVTDAVRDPLLALRFNAGTRKSNFKDMFGDDDRLASAAAGKIKKLHKRRGQFREKIVEHADEVSSALCPTSGTPQRYAALSFLVEAEGERKKVIRANSITYLEVREWYADGYVSQVYNELELSKSRRADATLMGVASILAGQEPLVLNSEAPFNHRSGFGNWGWAGVLKRWPEVENQIIDYFALMHMFTEIANDVEKGICI